MTAPQNPQPIESPSPTVMKGWGLVAASLAVLLCLGLALSAGLAVGRFTAPTPAPASSTVVRATPSVIVALRDLARLESASMHVERVVDLRDDQSRLWGLVHTADAIVLVAVGDVTAGVDLSKLVESDVRVDQGASRVRIMLPPAEVFSARLDSAKTYVHARETDLLARRQETLETEARREAERSLEEAATQSELIERAERSAATTVESLARALGYREISVQFRRRS